MLEFYNKRRRKIANAVPNSAHYAIAKLEEKYKVTVVTQNVDDLHIGDLAPDRSQLRPHIVWFGEKVMGIIYIYLYGFSHM